MHRVVLTALLSALLFACFPSSALASFGDCNSGAYLGTFDPQLADTHDFLCVPSDPISVPNEGGTARIRIIQHLVSDWALRPGAMRALKSGVAAAASAMGRLGPFRLHDTTILLVDGFGPRSGGNEDFGDIAAWTVSADPNECKITIWLLAAGATAQYGAGVIAHELFHCVEGASLTPAQIATTGNGTPGAGNWWFEGAADWFASVAVSAPTLFASSVSIFDRDSPTTPLNHMSYDGYVFFAWLGGAHGTNSVMPFLHHMATGRSDGPQRAAMVSALPADDWLHFAEDYWDRRIRDGQGASINSTPQDGDNWDWTATATRNIALEPFTLRRGRMTLHCGRWTMNPSPNRFHAVKEEGSGTHAWGPVPGTIDAMTSGASGKQFRFVGMNAGTSPVTLRMQATLAASCQECGGTREIDRCLVGTWQMTSNGGITWLRAHIHNAHITDVDSSGNYVTYNSDGTFATTHSNTHGTVVANDNSFQGTGERSGQGSGTWSAAGGSLNICPQVLNTTGSVHMTGEHGFHFDHALPPLQVRSTSMHYTCTGSSFSQQQHMPDGSLATSTFAKVSAPPH